MADRDNRNIAFQGISGAFTDLACRRVYPDHAPLPCATFEDVFEAVQNEDAALGMIPIENSQAGRVAEIHTLFPQTDTHIIAEHFQRISHHLLAPPDTELSGIRHVYSHPQALLQCRRHLKELGVEFHPYGDTALAAADVARWADPTRAALASELAGELYELENVRPHMEDSRENTTVFVTIARERVHPDPKKGPVLTSLFFRVRNIPAALYKALGGFATCQVNLLKLESYIPIAAGQTRASFFVTFEGALKENRVQIALEELGFFTENIRVFGEYPAAPERFR